ncbi:hypothetical protein VKT23_000531 [Stygiomarasmius scandens]|uniref:F-box domain-containing protein n=1 Tax=Marasmiellus scandens TaxID=2682957 RepID=A0ABR1K5K8_9AGAR
MDLKMRCMTSTLCARCQVELVTTQAEQRLPPLENEKLSSSYIPSDTDLTHIPFILKAEHWQQGIERYDREIDTLSDILTTLKARRDDFQREMDRYKAVVSPVRRIPVEIWIDIFSFACCDRESRSYGLEISLGGVLTPALALAQTCSLWRSIAISSSKLWSALSINLACIERRVVDLVKLYIHRSGSAPLTLSIFAHDAVFDKASPLTHYAEELTSDGWDIFLLLLQAHVRWYNVYVDCLSPILDDYRIQEYADDPANWLTGHFDLLRVLSLVCDFNAYFCSNQLFRMFNERDAPLLDCLDSKYFDFEDDTDIKFSNLQKITVHSVDNKSLFEVFERCPNLQEAVILTDNIVYEGELNIIMHEKLESLKIDAAGRRPLDAALLPFSFLTLPSLTILDLTTSIGGSWLYDAKENLTDMLVRSSCALQELKLSGDLFASDEDLLDVLELTPTVAHFTLDVGIEYLSYFTRYFFRSLTFGHLSLPNASRAPKGTVLPRLKRCKFVLQQEFDDDLEEPDGPLLDVPALLFMLSSRRFLSQELGLEQLTTFELSASILPGPSSVGWAESLQSALGTLSKEKMKLRTDIRFLDH